MVCHLFSFIYIPESPLWEEALHSETYIVYPHFDGFLKIPSNIFKRPLWGSLLEILKMKICPKLGSSQLNQSTCMTDTREPRPLILRCTWFLDEAHEIANNKPQRCVQRPQNVVSSMLGAIKFRDYFINRNCSKPGDAVQLSYLTLEWTMLWLLNWYSQSTKWKARALSWSLEFWKNGNRICILKHQAEGRAP